MQIEGGSGVQALTIDRDDWSLLAFSRPVAGSCPGPGDALGGGTADRAASPRPPIRAALPRCVPAARRRTFIPEGVVPCQGGSELEFSGLWWLCGRA
jgi:hypothetical protein